ncbi:undecaprenyl-phosphate glucose phosphotransferase [Marichromatium bheemlicum]|uniref:Undecaprenyl-phosphate glucose phosphotransferase n=1 Tax=Marichromatium bheemlicum TaxID=365339 RepID=A0ABX1IBC5_9GAMM|nr:undecaprenyl-phosphate glucose phosphotransferase [Marichromatium bheemlicum]NKN34553.1 undecaprenyl-phosphate glucose phosphotransferase [Marichromatium bheemlicum]
METIVDTRQSGINQQAQVSLASLSRLHYLLYAADILALLLTGLMVFALLDLSWTPESVLSYGMAATLAALIYSFFAFQNGLYDWKRLRANIQRPTVAFQAQIVSFGMLLLIGFTFKITHDFSRLWAGFWMAGFSVHLLSSRLILNAYLAAPPQSKRAVRRAVIVGAGENGRAVLEHIRKFDRQGIQVVGFIDDRASDRLPDVLGAPLLGPTSKIEDLVRREVADLVIIALPWTAYDRIKSVAHRLATWSIDIYLATGRLGLDYADRPVFRVGGMHVLSLHDRPISDWSAIIKRIEDLLIAVPALILVSPIMLLTAIAIKLESKGPVLFAQKRYGFNNNLIRVYKFRSMYTDMTDHRCDRQTTKNDPRITRVGRLIRKTSIDELPQLFNVLLGNMSIVGPRPHATGTKSEGKLLEDVVQEYARRHKVKPGITGWAQCNGWRGETDTREKAERRVEHDLYYIENWSVFLDLLVVLKTAWMFLGKNENAY